MTDRELLEAAAKAAGLRVVSWLQEGYPYVFDETGKSYGWSPLVFDSDALRLAVKLQLEIVPIEGGGVDVQRTTEQEPFGELLATEAGPDPYAATRRAIVRAAAAIGNNKE